MPRLSRRHSLILTLAILAASPALAPAAMAAPAATAAAPEVRYATVKVDGLDIFYREAGPKDAPVILLLHGFPASSFMYRDLIPALATRYRVIAPDYPGFGYSSAPPPADFTYSFDRFADVMDGFTAKLGLTRYALYMQDFGGPVGFRLASRHPDRVSHLIVQNANAYAQGLPDSFWAPVRGLWAAPTAENFGRIRDAAMSDAALEWNYTHGVRDPARVNPDSWMLQRALLARPGNKDAMLALLYDYRTNLAQYPVWQRYFRDHRPPTLMVWGQNDIIFPAAGARAYLADLPDAELHLLDTGHFALEDKVGDIAVLIDRFMAKPGR
jgi:pimeloyl-ACP methyl ester carboxylesterase